MIAPMAKQGNKQAEQPESDEALMLRFGRGELPAFEELYRRHAARVWRYIRRSVDDAGAADELMQEVWLRVLAHARGYETTARFTTWLFTMARSRVIEAVRVSCPQAEFEADESPAQGRTGPFGSAVHSGLGSDLLAALAALPHPQREAFLLQAEGGLSVAEIAVACGVTVAAAGSRLRQARAALRTALGVHA
jgi:RNA polymerase sigma-70 factor (ECF subfamily)